MMTFLEMRTELDALNEWWLSEPTRTKAERRSELHKIATEHSLRRIAAALEKRNELDAEAQRTGEDAVVALRGMAEAVKNITLDEDGGIPAIASEIRSVQRMFENEHGQSKLDDLSRELECIAHNLK